MYKLKEVSIKIFKSSISLNKKEKSALWFWEGGCKKCLLKEDSNVWQGLGIILRNGWWNNRGEWGLLVQVLVGVHSPHLYGKMLNVVLGPLGSPRSFKFLIIDLVSIKGNISKWILIF